MTETPKNIVLESPQAGVARAGATMKGIKAESILVVQKQQSRGDSLQVRIQEQAPYRACFLWNEVQAKVGVICLKRPDVV
jgi:hypothetical protein